MDREWIATAPGPCRSDEFGRRCGVCRAVEAEDGEMRVHAYGVRYPKHNWRRVCESRTWMMGRSSVRGGAVSARSVKMSTRSMGQQTSHDHMLAYRSVLSVKQVSTSARHSHLRRSSPSTEYASLTAWNFSLAPLSFGFTSGWYFLLSWSDCATPRMN
jgi:hypothetical protein